jgi:hypothetical protein
MVGGHRIAVLTDSVPDERTRSSTFLWNASLGRPVRSCTAVQSLYSRSEHSPSLLSSRIVSQHKMPAPPVCSQNPGFSLEWPEARPLAMAFAAPSLSDASAVSDPYSLVAYHVRGQEEVIDVRMTTSAFAASSSMVLESSRLPMANLTLGNASLTGLAFSSGGRY